MCVYTVSYTLTWGGAGAPIPCTEKKMKEHERVKLVLKTLWTGLSNQTVYQRWPAAADGCTFGTAPLAEGLCASELLSVTRTFHTERLTFTFSLQLDTLHHFSSVISNIQYTIWTKHSMETPFYSPITNNNYIYFLQCKGDLEQIKFSISQILVTWTWIMLISHIGYKELEL